MTGIVEDVCINSQVIPRKLLNVCYSCSLYALTISQKESAINVGPLTFASEYEASIRLLLCPDLDKCVDKFIGSICQEVRYSCFLLLIARTDDVSGKSSEAELGQEKHISLWSLGMHARMQNLHGYRIAKDYAQPYNGASDCVL